MTEQSSAASSIRPPGRLGDPDMSLATDPRSDPRMIAAMAPIGMDQRAPALPIGAEATLEQILELANLMEEGNAGAFDYLVGGLEPIAGVVRQTRVIEGSDGNEITLFIHRPESADGELPGLVHIHGGGMTILSAADGPYVRLRDEYAAAGMVVVGVEFRNAGGKLGPHPFPAGLDDCCSAVRWTDAHRDELGIGKIVVSGESGGGNLTLAVTHRARREGWLGTIAGVYAQCPYISGLYAEQPAELPSMRENDDYFIGCSSMALLARAYDPEGAHSADPECWPYAARVDDLRDMPPHVISVNELDPLRDEGLAYYRRLAAAGVSASARIVPGTCHGGDLLFGGAMPAVHAATVRDVWSFAISL
jgi:acetyl esterase/lipase